jgi:hypothetical protein
MVELNGYGQKGSNEEETLTVMGGDVGIFTIINIKMNYFIML